MNLKELRQSKGLTQMQLAKLCGVEVRTIQNWETTDKELPESKQVLLEAALNTSDMQSPSSIKKQLTFTNFLKVITKQQEIMAKQLEELVEFRNMLQRKDEQVDYLIKMHFEK